MLRNTILAGTALTVLVASVGAAQAGGFALRTHSAYGLGSAFAGIAAPGDSPSSMFWNPSAVTGFGPGLTSEINLNLIIARNEIDVVSATAPSTASGVPILPSASPLAPVLSAGLGALGIAPVFGGQSLGTQGTDNTGSVTAIPTTYTAYNLARFGLDDVSIGIVNSTPFGLVTQLDADAASRFHGRTSDLRVLNSSPTIGFQVNEQLSIAAGVQISYADVRLTQASLALGRTPPQQGSVPFGVELGTEFEGDDIALGFTLGATFRPTDTTTIGLGFRSHVSHTLEGEAKVTRPVGAAQSLGDITADLELPEIVTFGLRQQVTPRFTALAGVEWTNWSRFEQLRVDFATPGLRDSVTPQNYEDGWYFSLGGEFKATEQLTLRTGLGYEISPVEDEFRTPRTPDTDRVYASIGASYEISDRFLLNAGYTHIFAEDGSIDLSSPAEAATRGTLVAESETAIDVIGVSLRLRLGGGRNPVAVEDTYYK